jgi:hypothetical protein
LVLQRAAPTLTQRRVRDAVPSGYKPQLIRGHYEACQ